MANLTESPIYESGIFQLEKSTPPLGGAPVIDNGVPSAGHANAQGLQLANRTSFLKAQVDSLDGRVDVIEAEIVSGGSATSLAADLANKTDSTKGSTLVGYDSGTVTDVLNNAKSLPNYAALRAYTGVASTINLIDDFRSGRFRKVATVATGFADDAGITIVAANGWVWQRINVGDSSVDWFLPTDWVEGVTNDTPYIARALRAMRARGGGTVKFFRRHLIDTTLFIHDLVHFKGPVPSVGQIINGELAYDKREGVLIINPAATIYAESSSSLTNCILINKNLVGKLPFTVEADAVAAIAAFSGTAVTPNAPDFNFRDCLVLGFNKAYYSYNWPRARITNIQGDCTNGIHIENTFDVADISNCHFWPFLTVAGLFSSQVSVRNGAAYKITNSDDWARFTNCFSFGYNRGFVADNAGNLNFVDCGTDYAADLTNTTSIGFEISGGSRNTSMIGCRSISQWRGVVMNSTATTGAVLKVEGGHFATNDECDIRITLGSVLISGNTFRASPTGVYVEAGSGGAVITSNMFDAQTIRPVDGDMTRVVAGNNSITGVLDTVMGERKITSGASTTLRTDSMYGSNAGPTHFLRRAGGTLSAPSAVAGSAPVGTWQSFAHNGTGFGYLAGFRFQTKSAQTPTSAAGSVVFATCAEGSASAVDRFVMDSDGSFKPLADGTQNLGAAAARFNNSYFAVAPTVGSDSRYKTTPKVITDKVLDAWADVDYKSYQLLDAVAEKGKKNARQHFGVIAQQVVEAFKAQGLDATDYGLLCHDSWESSNEIPEQLDAEGNIVVPKQEAIEASDRYSIRYEEALVLESALMRRTQQRLEARLKALEDK